MSDKTLPDELRSVLLEHSFEAPDADDTIARTLAETVETVETVETGRFAPEPGQRRWRSNVAAVAAAVVVGGLAVGGAGLIAAGHNGNSAKSNNSARTAGGANDQATNGLGSNTLAPGRTMGPAQVTPHVGSPGLPVPSSLDCATAPGRKTVVTSDVTVRLADVSDQVVSAQCTDATGRRNASQVYTVRISNGQTKIEAAVISRSAGISVESITAGDAQFTVRYLRLATVDSPEALLERTFSTADAGLTYLAGAPKLLAPACTPAHLLSSVVAGPAADRVVLRVLNSSGTSCELSGYPGLPGARRSAQPGIPLVPVVLLPPEASASAVLTVSGPSQPCSTVLEPPRITLPSGQLLTEVRLGVPFGCYSAVSAFTNDAGG